MCAQVNVARQCWAPLWAALGLMRPMKFPPETRCSSQTLKNPPALRLQRDASSSANIPGSLSDR